MSAREILRARAVWDIFVLVLILLVTLFIPYQVFILHEVSLKGSLLVYLIDVLFIADIYLNFRTSIKVDGIEVTNSKEIKSHYLRNMFIVDLLANFPFDLILLILMPEVLVWSIPLVLLLRLPRLLRLARAYKIIKRWEQIDWVMTSYLRILNFFIAIIISTHWVSCLWFFTAYKDGFPENSWVSLRSLTDAAPWTQYFHSLYWSITTMTSVGYGDIVPHRHSEYILTMVVMFLGASLYAFIIGIVAAMFGNLDAPRSAFKNKTEATTRYLRHMKVPDELVQKTKNYYDYLWARRRGINETTILQGLPRSLQLEITKELAHHLLAEIPLFKYASATLRDTLITALQLHTYPPNDWISKAGQKSEEIVFLAEGQVTLYDEANDVEVAQLKPGDYFGDLSLILGEPRTISARSEGYSEVFILSKLDFLRIKSDYPELKEVLAKISGERGAKIAFLTAQGYIT